MQGIDIAVIDPGTGEIDCFGDSPSWTQRNVCTAGTYRDARPTLGQVDVNPWGDLERLTEV